MPTDQRLHDELSRIIASEGVEVALERLEIICQDNEHDGAAWELRGLLQWDCDRPCSPLACRQPAY